MGIADIHIHTIYSNDGTCTVSAVLKYAAQIAKLDVIAITDHDRMEGVAEALELAPRYGVDVVPGCEVTTAEGHLLALFIHEPVPAGLSLVETILRVGDQGGLCVAPHPMARVTRSLNAASIRMALRDPDAARILKGIEVFNAGLVYSRSNLEAQTLAQRLPLAQTGSSDAHLVWMIAQGATVFPGKTAADLRQALVTGSTFAVKNRPWNSIRLVSAFVSRLLLRKAGWVTWNPGPHMPSRLGRLARIPITTGYISRKLGA